MLNDEVYQYIVAATYFVLLLCRGVAVTIHCGMRGGIVKQWKVNHFFDMGRYFR